MSRYENHIETGLGTKNRLFQGVCRLLVALQSLKNWDSEITQGLPGEIFHLLRSMIISWYIELMQAWFQGTLETESVMAKS